LASWLDSTLDALDADIVCDIAGLGLIGEDGKDLKTILARPLSAAEYQVLKSNPEIKHLTGDDRTEALGLRMTYEMLAKCDNALNWTQFKNLPLNLLGKVAEKVIAAVGSPAGGGALGEA
jgi:hypothetical protein